MLVKISSKLVFEFIWLILFVALISVYSNSTQDVVNPLLYQGFIEETVELLELDQAQFTVSPFNYVQLFKYFCYFVSLLLLLLFVCLFLFLWRVERVNRLWHKNYTNLGGKSVIRFWHALFCLGRISEQQLSVRWLPLCTWNPVQGIVLRMSKEKKISNEQSLKFPHQ